MVASASSYGLPSYGFLSLSKGYTAEYIEAGEGDPLVLVPGLAGGVELLEPLIDELSKSFRVISYQLRGEGPCLFQRGFSFRQLTNDLDEIISSLRLERPGLLGVSFGGAVALDYATRNSHKLSFLGVQGAAKDYNPGIFGNVAREVLDRLPLTGDNPFINQFFSVLIGGRRTKGDQFDFIVDRCWRTDQSVMAHRLALLDDYDIDSTLSSVRVPTLVLGGDHDVLVAPEESQELARRIPQGRFEMIEDAGHLAFVTHPRQFTARIKEFGEVFQAV